MKKQRRIEITAFRRRVLIVSGDPMPETVEDDLWIKDGDSQEGIEIGSREGQAILRKALRLLAETRSKKSGQAT